MVQEKLVSSEKTKNDENVYRDEISRKLKHDEWKEYLLNEIATINPKTGEIPEKFCYIDLESVHSGILKNKNIISSNEAPSRAQRVLRPNDILYQTVRPYQKNNLFFNFEDMEYVASTGYAQIRTNELCTAEFLYYLLHTEKFVNTVLARCTGTSYPAINSNDLKKIKVKIPNLTIQNQIAKILIVIDKKIELLENKLVLYQKHNNFIKNHYFDNLQGEKVLKFKEIIKKGKAGGTPKSTIKEYYDGPIPFLSINDMTSQGKFITETEKSITKKGLDNSSAWIVPKNSLLYSIYASIGFVSINKIDLSTSQAIYGIILKETVNQDFIYHYLKNFRRFIHKYIETGTQGNLNSKIVQNIEIKLPSLEEQIYYSNLFNKLDNKIGVAEKEIDKIKEFKKGLLQRMFI